MEANTHNALCERWYKAALAGDSWEDIARRDQDLGLAGHTIRKRTDRWCDKTGRPRIANLRGKEAPSDEGVPSALSAVEFPDLKRRADPGWGKEFLRTISKVQHTMTSLDTTQNVAHATINTDLPVGIVFPGDFHIGGRGTDHERFLKDMEMWQALGDAVKLIGMGDYSEQFTGSLARIGLHQHVITNDMQIESVMDLFCGELGNQFIAFIKGNHDGWAGAELSNYVMRMAQRCGVPFLGLGGELYLTVGTVEYKIAAWHRYPGASAVNKGNNQRRVRVDHNGADVVALAHLHNVYVEFAQTSDLNHIGLRCGAYKVTDEHSRDAAGNVIADVRMPMIILNPRDRDLIYTEDFRKGIPMLLQLRREWSEFPSFKVDGNRLQRLIGA